MANVAKPVTAVELARMPDDGSRYELVKGVLRMMSPAGGRHGRIASKLLTRISVYVEQHALGYTYAAETGFLLEQDPDTVRAPDVAFVSHAKIRDFANHPGYLPVAPDFVAEVVSPNDASSDVEQKAAAWLAAGTAIVLVVDPQTKSIRQYKSADEILVFKTGMMELPAPLSGFALDVDELFAT